MYKLSENLKRSNVVAIRELTNRRLLHDAAVRLRDMLTAHAFLSTLPASRQRRRRWWERFAGVLETGGREVSFPSFLSIVRVFLPDNSSITLGACPWRLILILFACFRSRNDLLLCHGERYEFNQHWRRSKHDTVWMKSEINALPVETKLGLVIVVWFLF